jgi:hypothetical protein
VFTKSHRAPPRDRPMTITEENFSKQQHNHQASARRRRKKPASEYDQGGSRGGLSNSESNESFNYRPREGKLGKRGGHYYPRGFGGSKQETLDAAQNAVPAKENMITILKQEVEAKDKIIANLNESIIVHKDRLDAAHNNNQPKKPRSPPPSRKTQRKIRKSPTSTSRM